MISAIQTCPTHNERIAESVRFIRKRLRLRPNVGIILGSGLGDFAERLSKNVVILAEEIPNYPGPTVEGHKGKLIVGRIGSKSILAFQGRVHFYEVGNLFEVLYPILVASALGIRTLLVTNAAGGINRAFTPADLMLITDHINLTFLNPLLVVPETIPLQLSSTRTHSLYDVGLQEILVNAAREKKIPLRAGVYCGVKGPSYETAAEVEMIRRLGGDAVGMSTVNEVTLANALGMRVAGISCITNYAAGITSAPLSHDEVTEVASRVKLGFANLVEAFVEKLQ